MMNLLHMKLFDFEVLARVEGALVGQDMQGSDNMWAHLNSMIPPDFPWGPMCDLDCSDDRLELVDVRGESIRVNIVHRLPIVRLDHRQILLAMQLLHGLDLILQSHQIQHLRSIPLATMRRSWFRFLQHWRWRLVSLCLSSHSMASSQSCRVARSST